MAQNVYSLIISYRTAGQFAQNVTHWQFEDSGYTTTKQAAEALQLAFDTARRLTLRQILPTDVTIISYRGSRVTGAGGGFEAFSPISAPNVGLRPGTQSASALNPVIIMSSVPFTRGRGKIFLPGISETDIEDGKYTDAYKAAVNAGLITLFDDLTLAGAGTPNAVNGWITSGGVFRIQGQIWLSQNLGTQRRRMKPA